MRPRRQRRWLIVGCLLLLLLVPAYLFIFVGQQMPLAGTPYVLVIQPGVSQQSVALAQDGLTTADQFLRDRTGSTVTEQMEVRIATFSPCSPLRPLLPLAATANVVGNRLCINTQSGVWKQALREQSGIAFSVMAHEHYHLFQHQLGCLRASNKEYEWIMEGSAAYIGWETAITAGKLERSWVDTLQHNMRKANNTLGPLQSYEQHIAGDAAYTLAYDAVQQLIAQTGSLASLNDFCGRVGLGTAWRDAFAESFGLSVEQFYQQFEASRTTIDQQ